MRVPAKVLPCLLFCVACVILPPTEASAQPRAVVQTAFGHAERARPARRVHPDNGVQVARRRAKADRAAPKVVKAPPHDASNRFLMTQNGRQMTAADFDAWMKARGIRVAKGAPDVAKAAD